MQAIHSNTNRVIVTLIHSTKPCFKNIFVTLLRGFAKDEMSSLLLWHKHYDLMPQIFDAIDNGNARYKCNECEYVDIRYCNMDCIKSSF